MNMVRFLYFCVFLVSFLIKKEAIEMEPLISICVCVHLFQHKECQKNVLRNFQKTYTDKNMLAHVGQSLYW